jgi:ribonucleoside-diphosphate reductase alpha chain
MIADLMTMLDNVLEYFIENAPDVLHRAKFSAFRERSVGLGMMGWHSYLQKNNIPWESSLAVSRIHVIQKNIKDKADQASLILGALRSEAPDMQGTGERFAHKLSVAPNANSSVICGTSASIEPISACIYTHRTRVGSHQIKNKYLEKILSKLNKNNQEIWSSIIANNGSVQHLDFLDQDTKDVFKTCFEIDQHWIIEHAAHRQKYIDQAQSLNLFFPFGVHKSYVNSVHLDAWKKGLKTLYYLRTETASKAEAVSQKVERIALKDSVEEYECLGCSG